MVAKPLCSILVLSIILSFDVIFYASNMITTTVTHTDHHDSCMFRIFIVSPNCCLVALHNGVNEISVSLYF